MADSGRERQTLTPRQQRAIVALLSEASARAAAASCGVAERTLYRWLADKTFRRAYREASRRLLDDAVGKLRAGAADAIDTLRSALKAEGESVRVRAAQVLLDAALKADGDELAARVEALEGAQRP